MAKQQKEKSYSIEWSSSARSTFFKSVEYISEFSLQGAASVVKAIQKALQKAQANPQYYPPDKFKLNNTKAYYRAFEVNRFRIGYKIDNRKHKIRIIFFRHTKQRPKTY